MATSIDGCSIDILGIPSSLSNAVHSEYAPFLPLPSLPVFCGARDQDLRLFDDRSESRPLNRRNVLICARKIADLLQNTDVSYLNLRADVSPQPCGFVDVRCLALHNEVLTCNSEAFDYIHAGKQDAHQRGTSSAEGDTRTDVSHPLKKLKSGKHVLGNTNKLRIIGLVNDQSCHSMEERDCSSTKLKHSTGGHNKLAVIIEEVDRELSEECNGSVVDVGILAPSVHSFERRTDKNGKLCDSEVQNVEGNRGRGTEDLSDHRSLDVTQGASAEAVQPCVGTTTPQPSGPTLALPFKKNSTVWSVVESMKVLAKSPQNPHFLPVAQYDEKKREEVAVQKMIKYVYLVDKISNLTIAELSSSSDINGMLESLKDLEDNGFNVKLTKQHLNNLLLKSEKKTHLQTKLEEIEGRIRNCNLEKAAAEDEVSKTATKMEDLEKELMSIVSMIAATHDELLSAKKKIETIDKNMTELTSEKGAIGDDIHQVQADFEGTIACLKQIFS